jgi:hypothetical protein
MNVYDSEMPWPDDERKITALRIVQVFPKTTPRLGNPPISYNKEINARGVLGTVPVEDDGSAHFEVPVGKVLYFQALDQDGLAIQNMRSTLYAMPGERITCQGCHEPKSRLLTVPAQAPKALKRAPSKVEPAPEGAWPLSFPRLVQPVLNRRCVACHARSGGKAPDLSGRLFKWYTAAYENLGPYAWCVDRQGNYTRRPKALAKKTSAVRSIPGEVGAMESLLYPLLTTGSHKDRVKLTDEEMERITMWLDCMSCFFGAYELPNPQKAGELIVPQLQ